MALETGSLLPGFACHFLLDAACGLVTGGTATASFLLYIDPGTGSMLFTLLLGLLGAIVYAVRVGAKVLVHGTFLSAFGSGYFALVVYRSANGIHG